MIDRELEERLQKQQDQLREWFIREQQRKQNRCDSESSLVKCEYCNCWKNKLENDSQ
jgi:hypothetical protein